MFSRLFAILPAHLQQAVAHPAGRIGRLPYWLLFLYVVVAFAFLLIATVAAVKAVDILAGPAADHDDWGLARTLASGVAAAAWGAYAGAIVWGGFVCAVKRLHDRDKSGHWLWFYFGVSSLAQAIGEAIEKSAPGPSLVLQAVAAFISLWSLIDLGFLRGTPGPNRFGPPPRL